MQVSIHKTWGTIIFHITHHSSEDKLKVTHSEARSSNQPKMKVSSTGKHLQIFIFNSLSYFFAKVFKILSKEEASSSL